MLSAWFQLKELPHLDGVACLAVVPVELIVLVGEVLGYLFERAGVRGLETTRYRKDGRVAAGGSGDACQTLSVVLLTH